MTEQRAIYNAVTERGYGPEDQGLTPEQFAARQATKALEEAIEAAGCVAVDNEPLISVLERGYQVRTGECLDLDMLARIIKATFDYTKLWQSASITDTGQYVREMADVAIPLTCAAEALDVDLTGAMVDKATGDIRRGRR